MTSTAEILTQKTVNKTCLHCGKTFTVEDDVAFRLARFVTLCAACSAEEQRRSNERERQEQIADAKRRQEAAWSSLCPPLYRSTVTDLLPCPGFLARVLAWQHGPTGLLLHGPTGLGKSRCAWLLLRREFDTGRKVAVLDSSSAFRYAAAFNKSCVAVKDWLDDLVTKDLLFLDDVFKAKLTDSFEQALFALIEQRAAHMRPIIATCNDTGESLAQRLSQDRAEALLRRLREFCQAIAFTK